MALWKARGGSIKKELEFRSWHCKASGRKFEKRVRFCIMALWKAGGEVKIKSWNLYHGIVEGKGGKFKKRVRI
jgi:hypothetical protein